MMATVEQLRAAVMRKQSQGPQQTAYDLAQPMAGDVLGAGLEGVRRGVGGMAGGVENISGASASIATGLQRAEDAGEGSLWDDIGGQLRFVKDQAIANAPFAGAMLFNPMVGMGLAPALLTAGQELAEPEAFAQGSSEEFERSAERAAASPVAALAGEVGSSLIPIGGARAAVGPFPKGKGPSVFSRAVPAMRAAAAKAVEHAPKAIGAALGGAVTGGPLGAGVGALLGSKFGDDAARTLAAKVRGAAPEHVVPAMPERAAPDVSGYAAPADDGTSLPLTSLADDLGHGPPEASGLSLDGVPFSRFDEAPTTPDATPLAAVEPEPIPLTQRKAPRTEGPTELGLVPMGDDAMTFAPDDMTAESWAMNRTPGEAPAFDAGDVTSEAPPFAMDLQPMPEPPPSQTPDMAAPEPLPPARPLRPQGGNPIPEINPPSHAAPGTAMHPAFTAADMPNQAEGFDPGAEAWKGWSGENAPDLDAAYLRAARMAQAPPNSRPKAPAPLAEGSRADTPSAKAAAARDAAIPATGDKTSQNPAFLPGPAVDELGLVPLEVGANDAPVPPSSMQPGTATAENLGRLVRSSFLDPALPFNDSLDRSGFGMFDEFGNEQLSPAVRQSWREASARHAAPVEGGPVEPVADMMDEDVNALLGRGGRTKGGLQGSSAYHSKRNADLGQQSRNVELAPDVRSSAQNLIDTSRTATPPAEDMAASIAGLPPDQQAPALAMVRMMDPAYAAKVEAAMPNASNEPSFVRKSAKEMGLRGDDQRSGTWHARELGEDVVSETQAKAEGARAKADALPFDRGAALREILQENGVDIGDAGKGMHGNLDAFSAAKDRKQIGSLLQAWNKSTRGKKTWRDLDTALDALRQALGRDEPLRLPERVRQQHEQWAIEDEAARPLPPEPIDESLPLDVDEPAVPSPDAPEPFALMASPVEQHLFSKGAYEQKPDAPDPLVQDPRQKKLFEGQPRMAGGDFPVDEGVEMRLAQVREARSFPPLTGSEMPQRSSIGLGPQAIWARLEKAGDKAAAVREVGALNDREVFDVISWNDREAAITIRDGEMTPHEGRELLLYWWAEDR